MTEVVSEGVPSREAVNHAVENISAFPGFGNPIDDDDGRWQAGWEGVEDLRRYLLSGAELTRENRLTLSNCRKLWQREDEEKNCAVELITLSKVPVQERLCLRDENLRLLLERQSERAWREQEVYNPGRRPRQKRIRRPRPDWTDVHDLEEAHADRGDGARRQSRRERKYHHKFEGG